MLEVANSHRIVAFNGHSSNGSTAQLDYRETSSAPAGETTSSYLILVPSPVLYLFAGVVSEPRLLGGWQSRGSSTPNLP